MAEPKWWERGAFGTEAIGEGGRFLSYLASRYGNWGTALGYRGIYSFQLSNSPLYREWTRLGKPKTGARFTAVQAPEPTEVERVREMLERGESPSIGEFPDLGRNFPDLFEQVTTGKFGLPLSQPVWGLKKEEPSPTDPALKEFSDLEKEKMRLQNALLQQQLGGGAEPRYPEAEKYLAYQKRLGGMYGRGGQGDSQRQQLERQWVSEQSRLVGMAQGSPQNWLKVWELQNQANPFAKPPKSTLDRAKELEADVRNKEPLAKAYKNLLKFEGELSPGEEISPEEKEQMQTFVSSFDRRKAQAVVKREESKAEWAAAYNNRDAFGKRVGSGGERKPPVGPYAPDWLRNIYPEQFAGPERETAGTSRRPLGGGVRVDLGKTYENAPVSGQAWNRLTESQRLGFAGFANRVGETPAMDVFSQMDMMRTKTPFVPRTWKSFAQV